MPIRQPDMPAFSFDVDARRLTLPLPEPYSYDETLHYLTRSPAECMHLVEDRTVHKLIETAGQPVWVTVKEHEIDRNVLTVRLAGDAPAAAVPEVASFVTDWLDLRTDLTPFYRLTASDPLLQPLADSFRGLRIVGIPNLFEALCWAIIGQQVNLPFAYALKQRFVHTFGEPVEQNGIVLWRFPQPATVQDLSPEALRELQFTGKKAEYIIGLARLIADGALSKESLLAARDEDEDRAVERRLLAIRGIGPWTAHYVMMRCLRDPAAFPIGDAGLHNALKQRLGLDRKPTEEEMKRLFSRWRGWEAYAVFYLWRSLTPSPAPDPNVVQ